MDKAPVLLLTRPRAASERFAASWRARRGDAAPVIMAPVVEIVTLPVAPDLSRIEAVIFTSENAVAAMGPPPRAFPAWCVGDRTAEAARAAGYAAHAAGGTAESLVAAMLAARARGPFLHARGRETRGGVAEALRAAGLECEEAVVYRQLTVPLSAAGQEAVAGDAPVLLPLFSPNSAVRLADALAEIEVRAPLKVAAMSAAVARAWNGPARGDVLVAREPSAKAMLDALETLARRTESP